MLDAVYSMIIYYY